MQEEIPEEGGKEKKVLSIKLVQKTDIQIVHIVAWLGGHLKSKHQIFKIVDGSSSVRFSDAYCISFN